ncbi:MAG: DNA mismatch repair endonuclease MutL, partial [Patescibacteria group bacterium]
MTLIKILSENLINQIAAGEVIERPGSVVKELVENSIDAGADNIIIEVKNGGKTFIKVSDNGCGMLREDLELSIERHATSKICEEADLWKIKTMGFRGEALPSIASISKLTIKSRKTTEVSGSQIDVNGGEILMVKDVGMSPGTQVEVFNLFFNTPVRQKYLKQDSTELSHISSLVSSLALANPNISFKLVHNEKIIFDLSKTTDFISRISDIFGKLTADAMIPIFYGGSEFSIDGFIGKPLLSRSTSQHQYFFVNGRYVQNFLLANIIKSAYHSLLMEDKKPVFTINIKIDPALVDVNVHP